MKALLQKVILLFFILMLTLPFFNTMNPSVKNGKEVAPLGLVGFKSAATSRNGFLSATATKLYSESAYQEIKDIFLHAVESYEESISLEKYHLSSEEAFEIYYRLYNETPHLFYLSYSTSALISEHNEVIQLNLDYYYPESMIQDMKNKLDYKISEFISEIDESWTDFEKALYVYDKLVLETRYTAGEKDSLYTIYGVFVENEAVCQGYASAYTLIMRDYLGIETYYIYSKEMNHAWNLIKLNGYYYHVDATWGDPQPDQPGRVDHRFFLLSDEALEKTEPVHRNWSSPYIANNSTYDELSFKSIQTGLLPTKRGWIGIDQEGTLYFFNFKKGVFRYGNHLTKLWHPLYETGKYYNKNYSTLLKSQETIYYNDHSSIYSLDPVTNKAVKIFTNNSQDGYIYGMSAKDSSLTYYLKKDLTQEEYLAKVLDLRPFSYSNGFKKVYSFKLQWMDRTLLLY